MVVWGYSRKTDQRYLIDVFNQSGMRTSDAIITQVLEYCRTYNPRRVVWEGNAQQKATPYQESMQRGLKSMGIKFTIYQTMSGVGGRAKFSNFDITTIGGLFDSGLITLPYGGTHEDVAKVDAFVDQLCSWRTDAEGHSIRYLKRDMVMACLFAESEAFALATKPKEKKPRASRRTSRDGRATVTAAGHGRRGVSSVTETGWQGWLTFDVQVALGPEVYYDDFAEMLARHIEFNLAGGLGNGTDALTGRVQHIRSEQMEWHPSLVPSLRLLDGTET